MKTRLKKLGFSAVVFVVLLLAAEVIVRIAGLAPSQYAQTRHLETEDKRRGLDLYPSNAREAFDVDLRDESVVAEYQGLGLDASDFVENTPHGIDLRYSAELCRGGDIGPKAADAIRVMVVGDSFAEGQGVREGETSAAHLARRLEDRSVEHEVLNCGRRGYDVSDVRLFLERHVATLQPDVILYAYTLNDPEQSEAFAAQQTFLDDWILARRRMVSEGPGGLSFFRSHLWAALADRLETASVGQATTRWYQDMVREPNAEGWDETLEHIHAMDNFASDHGAAFAVVIQPLLVELDGAYPFTEVHAAVADGLEDITTVDALGDLRGQDATRLWVHACDRHPNSDAQAIIAGALERALDAALEPSR